jgi:flagellar motor switch/type III secretory pathway protein FliN
VTAARVDLARWLARWPRQLAQLARAAAGAPASLALDVPALGGALALARGLPRKIEPAALTRDCVVWLEQGGVRVGVAVPVELGGQVVAQLLGLADSVALALGPVERGVLAYAVLTVASRAGFTGCVTLVEAGADAALARSAALLVVPVAVTGALTGELRVVVEHAPPVRAAVAADVLLGVSVELAVEWARTRVGAAELATLAAGDRLRIPEGRRLRLATPTGGFELTDELRVRTAYVREEVTSMSTESLIEDVPVEVAVEVARVRLSVRELLDLAPGAVVPMGAPVGPVELRAGGRRVARGELVDIDGELGVRVTEVG